MKIKLFFLICISCIQSIYALNYTKNAIEHLNTSYLPFCCDNNVTFSQSYGILNEGYIIPDKMYENFQLTEYFHASDYPDAGMAMCFKFNIGNGMYLGIIAYGGALENGGYSLVTVDQSYNVVDALEAGVTYFGDGAMKIKQFHITDGKEVYVYQLVPTTTKSIPLNTFRSVNAYLKCTIYRIDSVGKFIKISETRSENTRTLTRDELNDDTKNLWDWFQLKPATGVVTSVHP